MEGSAEKAFGAWVQLTDGKWVEVVDPRAKSEITPGNEVLNTDYGFASSSPRHVAAPYIETNARSSFELTMMIAIIIGVICAVLSIVLLILLRARTKNRSQEQSHKTDPDAQHCKAMHDSESAIALTEICNGVSQRSYAPSVKQTESAAMVGKGCNAALHKSNVFVGSEPTTPEIYTLPGPPVGCLEIGPMQLKCHLNSPGAILTDQPRSITGSGDLPESPCLAAYCGRSDTPRSRT